MPHPGRMAHLAGCIAVLGRVHRGAQSLSQHAEGRKAVFQGCAVRLDVHSVGQPADDRRAVRGECLDDPVGHRSSVGGHGARADDGKGKGKLRKVERTFGQQHHRCIRAFAQQGRVVLFPKADGAYVVALDEIHLLADRVVQAAFQQGAGYRRFYPPAGERFGGKGKDLFRSADLLHQPPGIPSGEAFGAVEHQDVFQLFGFHRIICFRPTASGRR